jgi:hypothetical protein
MFIRSRIGRWGRYNKWDDDVLRALTCCDEIDEQLTGPVYVPAHGTC